jgi:hypothetical protein
MCFSFACAPTNDQVLVCFVEGKVAELLDLRSREPAIKALISITNVGLVAKLSSSLKGLRESILSKVALIFQKQHEELERILAVCSCGGGSGLSVFMDPEEPKLVGEALDLFVHDHSLS